MKTCPRQAIPCLLSVLWIGVTLLPLSLTSCEEEYPKEDTKPVLSGFSPEEGGENELVIIKGENFTEDLQRLDVRFGDIPVLVESATRNELLVRLPQYLVKCGEVTITVVNDTTTLVSESKFTLACPTIESFSPTSGDIGDIITINGAHFSPEVSRIIVTIGPNGVTEVMAASTSTINVKLLNGYSGHHPIKVAIQNKVGVSSSTFRINGPLILDFSPTTANACDQITISGSDFSPVASENSVRFGFKEGVVVSATPNQLVVSPPFDISEIADKPVNISVTVDQKFSISAGTITLTESAWQKRASLDNTGRSRAVGFAIDGKGYTGLGSVIVNGFAELRKDLWEYDPVADSWTRKADLPGVARLDAVGFTIAGKAYVGLGGDHSNVLFNDFWQYDPATDSWEQMPDFPGLERAGAIAFSIGGKGYVGAGWGFGATNDIWEFDPENNTWTKITDYPGIGTTGMVCFSIGDKAYIGTGLLTNDFWEYTPSGNQWRQLNNFPEPFIQNGVSFAFNGFGIAGTGGGPNGERIDHIWKYDPGNDQWTRLPDLSGAVRNFAVGFPLENSFLIGTGSTSFNYDLTNDFYRYACQ